MGSYAEQIGTFAARARGTSRVPIAGANLEKVGFKLRSVYRHLFFSICGTAVARQAGFPEASTMERRVVLPRLRDV